MKTEVNYISMTDGAEDVIAYCARVSNPENQYNIETAPRLLKYLKDHRHWSPFEMADVTLEIYTTRDIARQLLRHRSFSFQEFSQRYAEVQDFAEVDAPRLQDTKNRQNSLETDDQYLSQWWKMSQARVLDDMEYIYREALRRGVAKEVARKILPEGLTMSRLYMKGSVRSWLHYLEVRLGPETQKEHREVAQKCQEVLECTLPSVFGVYYDV